GELGAKSIDAKDMAGSRECVGGMDAAIDANDGKGYLNLNEQFHFQIYARANAPILLDLIKDLWGRIGPYMNYLMETDAYVPQSNELHRQLLSALESRAESLV